MKSFLQNNDIEMCSTNNEGKSVIAERSIRNLKNKIDKYATSVSKNVYIDKLREIVHKYNNTYHNIIEMKPVDEKSNTGIEFSKETNDKDPKFKFGNTDRISKYKNIFAKSYTQTFLLLKKLKILCLLCNGVLLMIFMVLLLL